MPTWRASPQAGAGPKSPWQDARTHYKYLLHTARRAGPAAAMASMGMAQLNEHDGYLKGKVFCNIFIAPASFPTPPPLAAPLVYLDTVTSVFGNQVGSNFVTGLSTPIHIGLHFHTIIYTTMVV